MSFSNLPQIEKILNIDAFKGHLKPILTQISRAVLSEQRELLKSEQNALSKDEIIAEISRRYDDFLRLNLQPVINATGIVMHTNLARSVIDDEILRRASDVITGYSNLEFSLITGARSNRYDYVSKLLCSLFECEDALIVNNNASAVFLVLNTFANGGECVVSRGELVEIGGSFRVPDVMVGAGAILKEIGATNKTRLSDYENAINENTKMIFKAHRSNFAIVGFSQSVEISDLHALAKQRGVVDYYDLGSGYFGALSHGLDKDEPNVAKILKQGVSLVSFSGDKLFGSVQCGIILGKKSLISRLKKSPLLRMLRADKVILSILCESIKAYLNKEFHLITTLKLLEKSEDELINLANFINANLTKPLEIYKTTTFVGGGSLPNKSLPSVALIIKGNPEKNEAKFRAKNVIGRIENDKFLLDLRAILDKDVKNLIKIINELENE